MDLERQALEAWKVGEELSVARKLGAPESSQRADARGSLQVQAAAKVTHEAAKSQAHEGTCSVRSRAKRNILCASMYFLMF